MKTYLLSFDSIHQVLKAEKILLEAGYTPEVIPSPRDISSNCGMCLRMNSDQMGPIKQLIAQNDIHTDVFERAI